MARFFCILLLVAAACDRGQPVPTPEDNRQLDDAANLLDNAPGELNDSAAPEIEAAEPD